jgi:phosphopantothenoylcysteine decarboxylase/phosphopantothenate--cysteine ligase
LRQWKGFSMLKALVTSGPTRERIDPVRFITNDSSGKQGHAIAAALSARGVDVTLISGPVNIPDPQGVKVIKVESAEQMLAACVAALPVDIAICAAAVSDWRPRDFSANKIKKQEGVDEMTINFVKNPDILKILSKHKQRPKLVIGFAAETENLIENAKEKIKNKGCDWILANDVSGDVFGGDFNKVSLVKADSLEEWERMGKVEVAERLVELGIANLDS